MTSRAKVSVTLTADVLKSVDAEAARTGKPRSQVMNEWLRRASRLRAHSILREQTLEYYRGRSKDESANEAEELIAFSAAQAHVFEED